MLSDKEKAEIEKEARKLLRKFGDALDKAIGDKEIEKEARVKENSGFRKEGEGSEEDKDFGKRMFENAPKKDDDCIIAEKKKW